VNDEPLFLPWRLIQALRWLPREVHGDVAGRIVSHGGRAIRWETSGEEPLGDGEWAIPVRVRHGGPARPTTAELAWAAFERLETFGLWTVDQQRLRLYRVTDRGLVFLPMEVEQAA
jgi:hypothetical protein